MKPLLYLSVGLFVLAIGAVAAADGPVVEPGTGPRPWTRLDLDRNPDQFQFAIMADRNGGYRAGVFAKAIEQINRLEPQFVMCVGDLIEGYSEDPAAIAAMYDRVDGELVKLQRPFFFVPGNHDLSNAVEVGIYQQRRGKLYYDFVYRNVLFLCLDSEDPPEAHMGAAQLDYVRETLEKNKGVRWTLIFIHNPLWTTKPDENGWAGVEKALGDRPYTVFAGHVHQYCKYNRHGHDYYTLPTTGGGNEMLGPDFGLYDGITWVTMRDNGPMLANLDMAGILPDDILTPELEQKVGEAVRSGLWVQPVLSESPTIEKAATNALVTNTLDVPMQAKVEFRAANGISLAPQVQYLELPPNSRNTIAIGLAAASAIDLQEPVCLQGQYALSFQLPDRKEPRAIKRDCKLALDYMRPCPPVAKPVTVDGKLDEWESLPLTCEGKTPFVAGPPANWTGAKDASFAYVLGHDERYLYVAVRVTDDQIMAKPGTFPLDQDAMAVLIDARPDPERSQCQEEIDIENSFLVLIMCPGDTRDTVYRTDKLSPEIQMACVKTATGYSVEYAVPMAMLDKIQGKPWEEVRINVGVNDKDDDGATQLWWRPAWESAANYPGSGTFKKK